MVWIIGIIVGVILYFMIPNIPFLGAVGMGIIILWFSIFVQKLLGMDKGMNKDE